MQTVVKHVQSTLDYPAHRDRLGQQSNTIQTSNRAIIASCWLRPAWSGLEIATEAVAFATKYFRNATKIFQAVANLRPIYRYRELDASVRMWTAKEMRVCVRKCALLQAGAHLICVGCDFVGFAYYWPALIICCTIRTSNLQSVLFQGVSIVILCLIFKKRFLRPNFLILRLNFRNYSTYFPQFRALMIINSGLFNPLLLRVIKVKIPLQPHQKYYITQYGELGLL